MVYLSEESLSRPKDDLNSPDNPTEHKVCMVTLLASAAFLLTCAYYLLTPPDDGLKMTATLITGGIFILSLAGFFLALFTGKLCGCKRT